ncbi:hypothetical protein QBC42DRAFT_108447 [Cladorrhinum samala]|uniref:Secreted protein n=1 Tax=Cladorrhinum samala TaxID=585594 RepID=A0AAV9HYQ5_9PEZI|nr:hypothetical protein QBC42DRAFT_108447 [Cladorrhinum samala]
MVGERLGHLHGYPSCFCLFLFFFFVTRSKIPSDKTFFWRKLRGGTALFFFFLSIVSLCSRQGVSPGLKRIMAYTWDFSGWER